MVAGVASIVDYYRVLQVIPEAEAEVIGAAYRRLAQKYHPDHVLSLDADERMRAINEAFAVLSDPRRRRAYDATRRAERPAPLAPTPGRGAPAAVVALPPAPRQGARLVLMSLLWSLGLGGALVGLVLVWNTEVSGRPAIPTAPSRTDALPATTAPIRIGGRNLQTPPPVAAPRQPKP